MLRGFGRFTGSWLANLEPSRLLCAGGAHHLSTLVVIEHQNGKLSNPSLAAVSAANVLGGNVTAFIGGQDVGGVAQSVAGLEGVSKVLVGQHSGLQHQLAEPMADLLAAVQNRRSFTHLLAPATTFGKNLMPRVAAVLGVQPVSDIVEIVDKDTYIRPIYAGNAFSKVQFAAEGARVITVRPTSFASDKTASSSNAAEIEELGKDEVSVAENWDGKVSWIKQESVESDRPELGNARVVVSGGRALKSAENFKMLEKLADKLGGAIGASRAAVDAGFCPNDWQVGQTGKAVAPDLYIAVGISGAIQHLAGMKDSKTIVAINTDADAPIFEVADYALVQDLFTALPELEAELEKIPPRSG